MAPVANICLGQRCVHGVRLPLGGTLGPREGFRQPGAGGHLAFRQGGGQMSHAPHRVMVKVA